jgi:hypothetical protein
METFPSGVVLLVYATSFKKIDQTEVKDDE